MVTETETLRYHGKVRVVFMVQRETADPTAEHVYIVGSVPSLGDWDVHCARKTDYSGVNAWILEVFFEPHSNVEFKLCLMSHASRDQHGYGDITPTLVHREEGWYRCVCLTDVSIGVYVVYDRPYIVAAPLRSHVSVNERPWCVLHGNDEDPLNLRNEVELQPTGYEIHNYPGFLILVVAEDDVLDGILIDTRQLRSWAYLEPVAGECGRGDGTAKVKNLITRRRKKKNKNKKEKKTLKRVLRKYGKYLNRNDLEEGDNKKLIEEIVNKDVPKDVNDGILQQTIIDAGSIGWRRVAKMAAPVGLGLGAAAATMYFWFKHN